MDIIVILDLKSRITFKIRYSNNYDFVPFAFPSRYRFLVSVTDRYRFWTNVTQSCPALRTVLHRSRTLPSVTERYRTLLNVTERNIFTRNN
jgi:hypothetical protein